MCSILTIDIGLSQILGAILNTIQHLDHQQNLMKLSEY